MIDLQNILRMVKANENDKPRYGNLVKSQDGERSNAARHKALVASSRNAGVTLDGLFKTRAGFEEWISKFPEGIIDPKHCISCRLWDPEEKVLNEHTAWIIPRIFINYISIYQRRDSGIAGASVDKNGRYKAARKGRYVGVFDTAMEAHIQWIRYGVDVFDELLTTNAAIIDSVSLARVREIQDVFRRYAENNTIMKQIPASQLDRETLKQQYFNSLKGNS